MDNRKRNNQLKIYLTDEEKEIFEKKMKLANCKTMSHFLRKCVLEKEIYVVDLEPFRNLQWLLSNATNNINQIAKATNTTGVIYKNEIESMNKQIEKLSKEIWQIHSLLLNKSKKVLVISMAITKIHPIKSTINLAIDYITKSEKTDEKILVSSFKCHPSTAHIQFIKTREDNDTKGTVLARHLIQSFLPGEVNPIKAHEIGMELCKITPYKI